MEFTILMSIYYKESSNVFNRAMQSIWDDQTIRPSEIVLVEDGPLTAELYQEIDYWQEKLKSVFKVVRLEKNVGTGRAKKAGLEACSYDLIAIMDTDDVSLPTRFERQLSIFSGDDDIDVCGAWVGEFEHNESEIVSYRRTPESHDEIVKFAKSRSPVNHPTAMYKRDLALSVNGYGKYRTSQDYHLFVKMLVAGGKFYNIQESLVSMRMGNGQLESRRGGLNNIIIEVTVQREFYRMGFLSFYELFRNISVGSIVRMLPQKILKVVFRIIRKL